MEYISKTLDFHVKEPSVISFGKFDGLHRGHEFLMEKQIEQSNLHGYKRIIFTFDIPPKSEVLGVESKVIITNDEKEYVFEKSGIDYLIECPFVPQVMTMEADAFVRWIVKSLNVKCIIVGDDFRFGNNLPLIHFSGPTRQPEISHAAFCLKKKTSPYAVSSLTISIPIK